MHVIKSISQPFKKNSMKNFSLISVVLFLVLAVTILSCSKENPAVESVHDEENPITDFGYHDELVAHSHSLKVNLENPEPISFELPDGTFLDRFLIDGDIVVTREELEILKEEMNGERQYRTRNIVDNVPRTIRVLGYNRGNFALTTKMRTALGWAVNNYNALNTGLNFTLSHGSNLSTADIVVYQVNNSGAGGRAGFPNGCNPYKWVQINSGSDPLNTNVIEHIITHEIGHALGLRHTDWFNRASCGGFNNEGQADEGAIHIPGTPANTDLNSVMLACFDGTENGEFGPFDRVALETLYPDDNSRIQLFEGNNATQDLLGTINVATDKNIRFTDGENCYKNDEARSARLLNMKAGQRITIFDDSSPSGTFSDTRDDYMYIYIKQDFNSYTIGTFEQDINNSLIFANYCCGGNLDGKVSHLKSRN